MIPEKGVEETLGQVFASYYASSILMIAQVIGCPVEQRKERYLQLAHFLSQPERVKDLYQSCSDEEKQVLSIVYLVSGERSAYYSRKSCKESTMSNLALKGLILLQYDGYGKIDPKYYYRSYYSSLMIHPLIEPMVRQEGFHWLPLELAPEPERVRSFSYRRREQELYRLCQWVARNSISLTAKQLPNRQELRRAGKVISLSSEEGERLCFWGVAIKLLYPRRSLLRGVSKWEDFFQLAETERLINWGRSLPGFTKLLGERDYRFSAGITSLVVKLVSLIPPGKWFDPQPLASWIKEQELSLYTPKAIRDNLRLVLEEVLSSIGWVELGYTRNELVAFRPTPQGAVALGRQASLPEAPSQLEKHLVVQPNFEILAPVEQLSFWEAGLLEKFAERKSSDVISVYHPTQATLYRAAQEGVSLEEVLSFLETKSVTGIPENVRQSIEDWWPDFLCIRIIENALILEDNGSFSLLEKDIPELPSLDYRKLPCSFASWGLGQVELNKTADLFTLEALSAFAKPIRNGFQLDPERLNSFKKRSQTYYSRVLEVLFRSLKFVPQELLLTLKAYRGEVGEISLASLPVAIFPDPEIIRSLLEVPWFQEALIASVKNLAILDPKKVAKIQERLTSMGLVVEGGITEEG